MNNKKTNLNSKKKTLWITQTALFIALLVVLQVITAPLGNTFITGTIVNMLLIISVMTCGLSTGAVVSIVSPIMAKLLGIGPFWVLIPFIAAGNTVLVLIWYFVGNRNTKRKYIAYISALITAAVGKFFVLYVGIVQIAVPLLLGLPEPQAAVVSNIFSIPQIITATAGGVLASLILPSLKKAIGGTSKK